MAVLDLHVGSRPPAKIRIALDSIPNGRQLLFSGEVKSKAVAQFQFLGMCICGSLYVLLAVTCRLLADSGRPAGRPCDRDYVSVS